MAETTSDFLVKRLHQWGIRRIFGYPGDGINGVMGALNRHQELVRFIQTRHEEEAAFAACAHAKFTGQVGVCIATSGPGAIHLLNGLYDAKMDHTPVVAIVGQQAITSLGADYQQEVDLISLFKDVAGHYVHMASVPEQVRQLVDRSLRIAISERTVTCIILPNDVQEAPSVESPERKHGTTFTGVGYTFPTIVPHKEDLEHAAEVLNSGKRIAMLVGQGAMCCGELVQQTAETLGAGVAKALLAKSVLPDDLPYVTGSIGLLGTKPSWTMMMECDTLLMIGSGFPYSEFLPKEGQARGVQIDISPRMLGLRYPMEVNLHGDTGATLRALLPMLKRKSDRSWQEDLQDQVSEWWQVMDGRAQREANPINPQRLFWELSPRLPDNCIVTCDSGSAANWYARDLKFRWGMMGSMSGSLATMACGVAYAIGAKFAYPDRCVIALVGDGATQMLGMNGIVTISKYWKEWADPRLVVMVLDNRDLNQVTWEQRVMNGDPKFAASQDLPPVNYAKLAENVGLMGIEVKEPSEIAGAWDTALSADRPCVIDAHADPDVPPLPPHVTFEQAKGYMFSIFKGDPNLAGIVKQSAKQMIGTLLARGT